MNLFFFADFTDDYCFTYLINNNLFTLNTNQKLLNYLT